MAVDRYRHEGIAAIWERPNELKIWYRIWAAVAVASANAGLVEAELANMVDREIGLLNGSLDMAELVRRTDEIEAETRHNIIAATRALSERLGPEARIIHKGMTSSDVLDTCFSLQLVQSGKLVLKELDAVVTAILERAQAERMTLCMGRTHTMDAEPTTIGLWLIRHAEALHRESVRLEAAINEAAVCKISGAVGTYDLLPWKVERDVAASLGLRPAKATSQIISRSHYIPLFASMASIMACVEALATDIRLRAQSAVMEVQEPFGKGQKGSSAMPHKKNPILCENLCGLARTVYHQLPVALASVTSWGERDISHSSAERFIGPDMFITTGYALKRLQGVMTGLVVYPERCKANLERSPWWTGRLMDHFINRHNWSREKAYDTVQAMALAVLDGKYANLQEAVRTHGAQWDVNEQELAAMAQPDIKPETVDMIFGRVANAA